MSDKEGVSKLLHEISELKKNGQLYTYNLSTITKEEIKNRLEKSGYKFVRTRGR